MEPEGDAPTDRDLGDVPAESSAGIRRIATLFARQNRLRLDAEIIRDASLVASGLLTPTVGGPSVYPPIPAGANNVTQVKREWLTATGPDRYRRGIYTFFQRSAAHPALLIFDAPDATVYLHAPHSFQHTAAGADLAER